MDAPFPEYSRSLQVKIRRCRKKLRQIQGLEVLKRPLSSEELEKVLKKADIRAELQYLISEYESNSVQSENEAEVSITQDSLIEDTDMKRIYSSDTASIDKENAENAENCETELIQFSDNVTPKKVPRIDSTTADLEFSPKDVRATNQCDIKSNEKSSPVLDSHKKVNMQPELSKPKSKPKQKLWKKVKFHKMTLAGHSDLVLCVDCDDCYIISSSRDTTVKIWNTADGEEINNLRGHTGAVSSVILLSAEDSKHYLSELPIPPEEKTHRLAITGSTDCSVRVWSIISDGGKLELWDAITGYNYQSVHVAEEEIKCLKVLDEKIICGTADCILSIYKIQGKQLSVLFTTELEYNTTPHNLMNLSVYFEEIICGDDHPNLKVITRKSGKAQVVKLRNVKSGYGTSDSICTHRDVLISSAFDLDTGDVSLNVRKLPSYEYLYSMYSPDENVGRILSIAAFDVQNSITKIITGGQSLNVWELHSHDENSQESSEHSSYHNVIYERELAKPAIDSDNDSEQERDESEEDEISTDGEEILATNKILYDSAQAAWYDRWCTIL
ncbi:WD repeat-containing protein pop2 [Nymphon striatum]|nr:WD repeat-containing protein pop2 [Nymphon striatum]